MQERPQPRRGGVTLARSVNPGTPRPSPLPPPASAPSAPEGRRNVSPGRKPGVPETPPFTSPALASASRYNPHNGNAANTGRRSRLRQRDKREKDHPPAPRPRKRRPTPPRGTHPNRSPQNRLVPAAKRRASGGGGVTTTGRLPSAALRIMRFEPHL